MNKRQCVSCGAPIRIGASKCEYCGMTYELDYWNGFVKYIPIHMNHRKISAEAHIPDWWMRDKRDTDAAADFVKKNITEQLAEGLQEMVQFRMDYDIKNCVTIVRGDVWVEEPPKGGYW